jgi:excisionase family DNA binding protein
LKEDRALENETIKKQTLTREEAAKYLGVHVNTLDRSSIPRVRIGNRVLFTRATLDGLLSGSQRRQS